MCGIFVSVHHVSADGQIDFEMLSQKLRSVNADRGPDAQSTHRILLDLRQNSDDAHRDPIILDFFASELRLRGDSPITQPHIYDGNVFCWNGEVFDGLDVTVHQNDGLKLFEKLRSLQKAEQIRDFFAGIEGPYAFVYYHPILRRLFFARDPLGRRSLLIHRYTTGRPRLILTSVSAGQDPRYPLEELSTDYIYALDLTSFDAETMSREGFNTALESFERIPCDSDPCLWPFARPSRVEASLPPEPLAPPPSFEKISDHSSESVGELIKQLDKSVRSRVRDIPRINAKEGKASVAILFSGGIDSTVLAFLAHRHVPLDEPIDLLNVAFENPRKIRIRLEGNPGGLPRKAKRDRTRASGELPVEYDPSYMVPDRETGLLEVKELRALCPGRVWNFVEIDVPYEESQALRPKVEALMLPSRTVMDMSLAQALYFASRGKGKIRKAADVEPEEYISPARVLLNGLGSDELLGGYGRHRSAFNTGGWKAIVEELQLEIDRIPTRNLGRDDRIVSSHGKEMRHPFLSMAVVNFLASMPVYLKMDPRLEVGYGDKMLLRLAARKLGLTEASRRKKRAMQFGSHSARMEGERRGDTWLESAE